MAPRQVPWVVPPLPKVLMVLMVQEVLDWAVAREVVRLFLQMLEGVEVPQVSDRQTAQTFSEMSKNVSCKVNLSFEIRRKVTLGLEQ